MHFGNSVRIAQEQKASMVEHMGLIGLASVAADIASHDMAGWFIGAVDRSLERTGPHLGGPAKDLSDQIVSTSKLAFGAAAFEAARKLGGASDDTEWKRRAETIRREAAERALDLGTEGHAMEQGRHLTLRPNVAADSLRTRVSRNGAASD